MCGILVYSEHAIDAQTLDCFRSDVKARGPDYHSSVKREGIIFESSVLSLRMPFTPQPIYDNKSVFCYNGQIYDLPDGYNDTVVAYDLCKSHSFEKLISKEGEFAFLFYDDGYIWFGRDILGRRSLLYRLDSKGDIIVSSVATNAASYNDFIECDGGGAIYKYSLANKTVERLQLQCPPFLINKIVPVVEQHAGELAARVLETLKQSTERRTVRPNSESDVSIMFSGGLDCTLIAALLDDILPPTANIELLNVAFENRRTGSLWDTPDRLLAQRSIKELRARSRTKSSRLHLVEINVPYDTVQTHLDQVKRLMAPCATVIDLSIALAFYFASQPQSSAHGDTAQPQQVSNPRILFSGLGADELFAGYSRHTTAATVSSDRLAEELTEDFLRLPHRNLGRDDRVCASWGREVRYPFLDNCMVKLAETLPLSCKTDGKTTKIVLREAAKLAGLGDVAHEKKRAIQFGARSAKMDPGSGRAKGHDMLAS